MRILYITPSFQHPAMRGPTRHYHFVRELSQRHRITLLSLTRGRIPEAVMQEMSQYTERLLVFNANEAFESAHDGLLLGSDFSSSWLYRHLQLRETVRQMKAHFERLIARESFDLILFHGKDVFPVIEHCTGIPMVVDFCDATSMRIRSRMQYAGWFKRIGLQMRYWQIRRVEKKLLRKSPHIIFVSCRDREAILGPEAQAQVITLGVDQQYWKRRTSRASQNCLAFTGVMNYGPNEDAAFFLMQNILPEVKRSIPHPEVLIVGRDPTSALVHEAQRHPEVHVTGFVDDVRPYLERATIFVAPLRFGSGVQNKVLEAMAMQLPVVTTPMVAEGLRIDPEVKPPVRVAANEAEFAEAIVSLLHNPEERARLAIEGRRYVETYFVWSNHAQKLEALCLEAAGLNGYVHKPELALSA